MVDKSFAAGEGTFSFSIPGTSSFLCQTFSQVNTEFVIETKNCQVEGVVVALATQTKVQQRTLEAGEAVGKLLFGLHWTVS